MILRIFLFFSYILLVSTNTGFPVIPAQTYPIYQQNSYANPSANQPSNFAPYLQGMTAQNQSPPLNLSPSNIREILLNRILSSPSMQPLLDSNFRGYGSNLPEFNNNPIATNPVGNYFVDPTNNDKATHIETEEKPRKSRRRSSKSRRKHDRAEKNENISSKNERTDDSNSRNRETNKKSKKRSRKQNTEVSSQDNETKNNGNDSTKTRTKKRKNKTNRQSNNNSIEDTNDENPKPRRRRKKKPKSDKDNLENGISEQDSPNIAPKEIQDEINLAYFNEGIVEENRVPRNPKFEGNDLLKLIPNMPENFGNNFMKELSQFDNSPTMSNFLANYENIYKSMSSRMETNGEKEKTRRKPKRRRNHHRRRNGQKNKKSTEQATVLTNSNIPRVNPKIDMVTTERTICIDEKTHAIIDPIPKDENLKPSDAPSEVEKGTIKVGNEEVGDKFHETTPQDSDVNIKGLNPNTNGLNPNNDNEYITDGYIDDYYPLFTDNAAYNANKREVFVKNLGDTKYYYATDKANTDSISPRRFQLPEHVIKDYERNKQYVDIEKETAFKTDFKDKMKEEEIKEKESIRSAFKDKDKEDKITFRSPPLLELPDFQTRKVEKSEINPQPNYHFDENIDLNHKFVENKSSSYSEAKTPHYAGVKHNGIKSPKEKLEKDVETVFARSKVVNYGPVYIPEQDNSPTEISNQARSDENYFKDGDTTYVLAKSVDYPESFW